MLKALIVFCFVAAALSRDPILIQEKQMPDFYLTYDDTLYIDLDEYFDGDNIAYSNSGPGAIKNQWNLESEIMFDSKLSTPQAQIIDTSVGVQWNSLNVIYGYMSLSNNSFIIYDARSNSLKNYKNQLQSSTCFDVIGYSAFSDQSFFMDCFMVDGTEEILYDENVLVKYELIDEVFEEVSQSHIESPFEVQGCDDCYHFAPTDRDGPFSTDILKYYASHGDNSSYIQVISTNQLDVIKVIDQSTFGHVSNFDIVSVNQFDDYLLIQVENNFILGEFDINWELESKIKLNDIPTISDAASYIKSENSIYVVGANSALENEAVLYFWDLIGNEGASSIEIPAGFVNSSPVSTGGNSISLNYEDDENMSIQIFQLNNMLLQSSIQIGEADYADLAFSPPGNQFILFTDSGISVFNEYPTQAFIYETNNGSRYNELHVSSSFGLENLERIGNFSIEILMNADNFIMFLEEDLIKGNEFIELVHPDEKMSVDIPMDYFIGNNIQFFTSDLDSFKASDIVMFAEGSNFPTTFITFIPSHDMTFFELFQMEEYQIIDILHCDSLNHCQKNGEYFMPDGMVIESISELGENEFLLKDTQNEYYTFNMSGYPGNTILTAPNCEYLPLVLEGVIACANITRVEFYHPNLTHWFTMKGFEQQPLFTVPLDISDVLLVGEQNQISIWSLTNTLKPILLSTISNDQTVGPDYYVIESNSLLFVGLKNSTEISFVSIIDLTSPFSMFVTPSVGMPAVPFEWGATDRFFYLRVELSSDTSVIQKYTFNAYSNLAVLVSQFPIADNEGFTVLNYDLYDEIMIWTYNTCAQYISLDGYRLSWNALSTPGTQNVRLQIAGGEYKQIYNFKSTSIYNSFTCTESSVESSEKKLLSNYSIPEYLPFFSGNVLYYYLTNNSIVDVDLSIQNVLTTKVDPLYDSYSANGIVYNEIHNMLFAVCEKTILSLSTDLNNMGILDTFDLCDKNVFPCASDYQCVQIQNVGEDQSSLLVNCITETQNSLLFFVHITNGKLELSSAQLFDELKFMQVDDDVMVGYVSKNNSYLNNPYNYTYLYTQNLTRNQQQYITIELFNDSSVTSFDGISLSSVLTEDGLAILLLEPTSIRLVTPYQEYITLDILNPSSPDYLPETSLSTVLSGIACQNFANKSIINCIITFENYNHYWVSIDLQNSSSTRLQTLSTYSSFEDFNPIKDPVLINYDEDMVFFSIAAKNPQEGVVMLLYQLVESKKLGINIQGGAGISCRGSCSYTASNRIIYAADTNHYSILNITPSPTIIIQNSDSFKSRFEIEVIGCGGDSGCRSLSLTINYINFWRWWVILLTTLGGLLVVGLLAGLVICLVKKNKNKGESLMSSTKEEFPNFSASDLRNESQM